MATPPLDDPNFDRTVIYVLDHSEVGAVGVVLNRVRHDFDDLDGEFDLGALEPWRALLAPPDRVFVGGPVATDSLIAIAVGHGRNDDAWGRLTETVGTVDLSLPPDEVAAALERVRIFRGYSGWGPGQLDVEIDEGAWMVFDAADDDIFTTSPDDLWRSVVRRQGGRLSWIADAPDDISAN